MTDLLLRPDLLRRGMSEDDVRRALRTGEIAPLRPGAYLDATDPRWRDADERHRALTEATYAQLAPGAVVSHVSAAVRHRLPVWGVPLGTVHISRDRRSGGRAGRRLRSYATSLASDEIVLVDGLPTTSVARTVVDVARSTPFETAVAIADAALHTEVVDAHELAAAVLAAGGRRGAGRARSVIAFADARADGPGESRARVRMDVLGVAHPVLQHRFDDARGRHVGTVDFWWPREGIIGEFDGMEKYGRSLRPGEKLGDAVMREKRREDALRAQPGVRTVVRWTWDEIADFDAVAARLPQVTRAS
ncbi:hypothetical protein [Pseudonocardia endophytica]|uniref:hypothetical protein n=1 Tax=Pseudonocardia endophytica TaxID=401976 RepID=UPI001051695D|nr:hypothetical protein [Pseudonocardia endophytica]